MLNSLKEKKIYKNVLNEAYEFNKETKIENGLNLLKFGKIIIFKKHSNKTMFIWLDFYDEVISCGAIGEGYVPICAIFELIRIVKKGGHILLMMVMFI